MTHATSHTACVSHYCKVQLSPDLTMRYKISLPDNYDHNSNGECNECKINVQMLYDGLAWLGVGVSSDGNMVVSHAIMGKPSISGPQSYFLGKKSKQSITHSQLRILEDTSIDFIDKQTILEFTTTFLDERRSSSITA